MNRLQAAACRTLPQGRHSVVANLVFIGSGKRLQRILDKRGRAALAHHANALQHHVHGNQPLLGTPFKLYRDGFEQHITQQNSIERGQQGDSHMRADQVQAAFIYDFEHVDQANQGTDHAKCRSISSHRPEDLRLGPFSCFKTRDTPAQGVDDFLFLGVGNHQLNAGAQERIASAHQSVIDILDIALEPQPRHLYQFPDIVSRITVFTAEYDTYQAYYADDLI